MGDVAVAHASAPPLMAPASVDVAAATNNNANAAAAAAAAAAMTNERFSPGGHALRARARTVNYNLKKSDFGGTPAWLKASSAAPDGGLAHGKGGGGGEKAVTSSKLPTAAAAANANANGGRFKASTAAAKGKAPAFSIHARAAGEENAAAAAPVHQRAPRAKQHGLEFSRAALNNNGNANAPGEIPHPAGRGGAASTSQASSGRGGVPFKRLPAKAAAPGAKKRGRPPMNRDRDNNNANNWGSAPSPHRSFVSYGGGGGNSPSRAAYASMLGGGYEESPTAPAAWNANNNNTVRFVQNNGGNNEVTAAAAVAASAAAAGVLRKVQVREGEFCSLSIGMERTLCSRLAKRGLGEEGDEAEDSRGAEKSQ